MGQTLTLSSFVPEQQTEKLALIADANSLLDATLNPFEVMPAPNEADEIAAFKSTAEKLRAAAGSAAGQAGDAMPAAWPMRWTRWHAPASPPSPAPARRWCRA